MCDFEVNEAPVSQIPAVQLLVAMGYEFIDPEEALKERQGRGSNVLLENILRDQLKKINRISYRGSSYHFTDENINSALLKLKNIKYDGLLRTNEKIYDLITLGTAMEQTIEEDSKSFNLNYVDWRYPGRNRFHVTVEYSVERSRSSATARPDIVLFVNGIPFCIIECKAPRVDVFQGVSQSIRNQCDDYIPRLFIYAQMVMAINSSSALYGTVGTAKKFWSVWKEAQMEEGAKENVALSSLVEKSTNVNINYFKNSALPDKGRLVTEQDKALYSLCRPERLLEIAWRFTIFDGGAKKVARYQQYFVVKSVLKRVKNVDSEGVRRGGIIWHTQGSGKSLTMVMLARNLALDDDIKNPRIILVTDRDDLDRQLGNTFIACGLKATRATSGRGLLNLISEEKAAIITTIINKFEKACSVKKHKELSSNIFILADESHRSQFGIFSAHMRQIFPNACYLGFTGTPLLKKDKNSFVKFGNLIEPHYSIKQAVEDGAVVPLLYEGRLVEMTQDKKSMDIWFERYTRGLSVDQKADLRRKYSRAEMLNKADRVIYMRAFDISEHYSSNWKGTGFKAQLVAPDKKSALKYDACLKDIGWVTSEVIISSPDMRKNYEGVNEEPTEEVIKFWKKMMGLYGSEEEYTRQIISNFRNGEEPEILIVVDKLLTGFDAPRDTVLYLCKSMKEHSLLQAIARVNRLCDGKDFGLIIDYVNILGELDKALSMYSAFEGFDEADIAGTLASINKEIAKLPQLYSALWDVFKTVKHTGDEEQYELLLADKKIRDDFYERLRSFSKGLALALSSESFISEVDDETLKRYKSDLKKFEKLKRSVQVRYAEVIDYKDYEPQIKKLLDTHIHADEVVQLNEPVNIFNESMFHELRRDTFRVGEPGKKKDNTAYKADSIAHATKRTITEKMDQDPAFYSRFSQLIQQAIDDFRSKRISDLEYLEKTFEIRDKVVGMVHDDVPEEIVGNEDVMAYYGLLKPFVEGQQLGKEDTQKLTSEAAGAICDIFRRHRKVNFWDDEDAQNETINDIDDYLYDGLRLEKGLELSLDQMDEIIGRVMSVAKSRDVV